MSLLRKLAAKPWEHAGEMEGTHGGNEPGRWAGRAGLYLFLGVITSFFLLFTISHQMRSSYPDWNPVSEPAILWFNSLILVLASVALQLAANAAGRSELPGMRRFLLAALILSAAFILGQGVAWKEMLDAGYYAAGNPANAFFYMFTALHALHLFGGMWFLLNAVVRAFQAQPDDALAPRIGLCATYWHFLLVVWALLFYLLISS